MDRSIILKGNKWKKGGIKMKVEFTSFPKEENWCEGLVNDGEYWFSAKLFDEGSTYGINDGRVSKLAICEDSEWNPKELIVNYDRGWDIEPKTYEHKEILKVVLNFLENAPKRFEDEE